jgi:hypothetical protein
MKDQDDRPSRHVPHKTDQSKKEIDSRAKEEADANKINMHQDIINNMNQVPKFSDEWFELKEREISLRNGLKSEEDDDEKTAHQVDAPTIALANQNELDLGSGATDTKSSIKKDEAIADEGLASAPTAKVMMMGDVTAQKPLPATADGGDVEEKQIARSGLEVISSENASAPIPIGHNSKDEDTKKSIMKVATLEQVSDDSVPTPLGYTNDEDIKKKIREATLEQVSDDSAPTPICHTNEETKKKIREATLEQVSDDNAPIPFASFAQNDNDVIDKKMSAAIPTESSNIDAESIFHSTEEDDIASGNVTQFTSRQVVFLDSVHTREPQPDDTSRGGTSSVTTSHMQRQTNVSLLANTSVRDASIPEIPEAFLVEDEDEKDVAFAELVPPWWKRKQTYIVAIVMILIVIGAAVGGVQYSQKRYSQQKNEVIVFVANETTAAPSISISPSSSQMPSTQPSKCEDRSSIDPQMLEFLYFNLSYPHCAIDGSHAVVVDIHVEEGIAYMYVVFYLVKGGIWDKRPDFMEYLSEENEWWGEYTVSMSKNAVFIGVPFVNNGTGTVFVYEFNDRFLVWRKLYNVISPEDEVIGARFGQSLDVDNDLAVVSAPGNDTIYVYLRDESWKRVASFDMVNTTNVAANGNTIAVTVGCEVHLFHYNRKSSTVVHQQTIAGKDFEEGLNFCESYWGLGSFGLSQNHIAVSGHFGRHDSDWRAECYIQYRSPERYPIFDVALYYRNDDSENFTYTQLLNSSDFDRGFGPNLALDDDVLVVGGAGNESHVFVFSDGYWQESLELTTPDRCGYVGFEDEVHISNRDVMLVTDNSVYVYNVEECASTPSSVPSESPTSSPTNTCFMVGISIEHYYELKPVWTLERLNETDIETAEILESSSPTLRPTWGVTAFNGMGFVYDPYKLTYINESRCLIEGRYIFTIYKDPLFYNVTTRGKLIAEGREPGYQESTIFEVPH